MFLKFKKAVCLFIILGLFLTFFYVNKTPMVYALDGGAGWANFFQYNLKEFVLDPVARLIARRILSQYLDSIIQRINTGGRTGNQPAFVQNWRNFLTDAMYRGEDVFRVQLGNTQLCADFGDTLKLQFGVPSAGQPIPQNTRVNNLDPFSRRARCTMPAGWSTAAYQQDFTGNGGWEALARLSEPQNNFYGSFLMSLGELSAQRALDVAADENETRRGYTGIRAGGCQGTGASARCTFLGQVTTPGDILGEAGANYVDKNLGWMVTSDELTEVIFNLVTGLVGRLTNFGSAEPAPASATDPATDQLQACLQSCRGQNGSAYQTCLNQCYGGSGGIIPGDPDSLDPGAPDWYVPPDNDNGGGGGGGGGGVCSDSGGVANYSGDLQGAINAVIANNPGGIADAVNDTANSFAFLNLVASQLQTAGFNATTNVLNGNSNPNSGDLIAIWQPGDNTIERYDAVFAAGDADRPMKNAATSGGFTGDLPLSCTF